MTGADEFAAAEQRLADVVRSKLIRERWKNDADTFTACRLSAFAVS